MKGKLQCLQLLLINIAKQKSNTVTQPPKCKKLSSSHFNSLSLPVRAETKTLKNKQKSSRMGDHKTPKHPKTRPPSIRYPPEANPDRQHHAKTLQYYPSQSAFTARSKSKNKNPKTIPVRLQSAFRKQNKKQFVGPKHHHLFINHNSFPNFQKPLTTHR